MGFESVELDIQPPEKASADTDCGLLSTEKYDFRVSRINQDAPYADIDAQKMDITENKLANRAHTCSSYYIPQHVTGETTASHYQTCCGTQTESSDAYLGIEDEFSIRIGYREEIPRWKTPAVLSFNLNIGTFPTSQCCSVAKHSLIKAGDQWNSMGLGLTFEYVSDDKPAVFSLEYRSDQPHDPHGTLAKAFFPNSPPQDRTLVLYALSFEEQYVSWMENVFLHELGHILGLRHEFAERESKWSTLFGEENPLSVMGYPSNSLLSLMTIQPADRKGTHEFYACTDKFYKGRPINDYDPVEIMRPEQQTP